MNWDKVKSLVGKAAPLLGSLVGGPAGGTVGALISSALGVENEPSAIVKALETDPQAAVKLAEIEATQRVELERLAVEQATNEMVNDTQRILAVNQTMQVEGKSEHWVQYTWRPFWGFISGFAFLVVCVFVCTLGYKAIVEGNADAIGMIAPTIAAFTTLFAIPGGIVGVASWKRGNEKIERVKR